MKKIIYLLFIFTLLNSCSNTSKNHAQELCDCLKEAGLKKGINLNYFPREINENQTCFREIGLEIYNHMKDLSQDQRASYMKNFSKALLETECADIIFDLIPYDEMLENMERSLGRNNNSFEKEDSFQFSTDLTFCQCVKLSRQMIDDKEASKGDKEKLREIELKYRSLKLQCEKIAEGISNEELIAETKDCY